MLSLWVAKDGVVYQVASFADLTFWAMDCDTQRLYRMGQYEQYIYTSYEAAKKMAAQYRKPW